MTPKIPLQYPQPQLTALDTLLIIPCRSLPLPIHPIPQDNLHNPSSPQMLKCFLHRAPLRLDAHLQNVRDPNIGRVETLDHSANDVRACNLVRDS